MPPLVLQALSTSMGLLRDNEIFVKVRWQLYCVVPLLSCDCVPLSAESFCFFLLQSRTDQAVSSSADTIARVVSHLSLVPRLHRAPSAVVWSGKRSVEITLIGECIYSENDKISSLQARFHHS